MGRWMLLAVVVGGVMLFAGAQTEREPVMRGFESSEWRFGGELGRRVEANVDHWVLRAPDTNPGMLEILHRRDRRVPYPEHIPWAGEFPGKYLIAAVQACRMSGNPALQPFVARFVEELIAAQDNDGYLGPWKEEERLLGHWDLWGHYHCILGLLAWHDLAGDAAALEAAMRAGDAIAAVYGPGGRRPVEAGAPEVNLAVLHGLGELYRRTGKEAYLAVMHRVVEDMTGAGDWLTEGAAGTPYHALPVNGPRWESIHAVQGLIELFYITGEGRYRDAAWNLWKSIRDFDRHPSGAFSTHERAYGTVYEPGAIETCCSVAWEAFSVDILRLTGDPTVADEIELTTWNQVLGAQHPSGSWWTYNTPMEGTRLPSFHEIQFQVRPGTPELNCCSVNAPRGLGMLADWAVLEQDGAVAVNFYGPSRFDVVREDGSKLSIAQETAYPVDGAVSITVTPDEAAGFALRLRIPAWSKQTRVEVDGAVYEDIEPGTYLNLRRTWQPGDTVELWLDLSARHWAGKQGRHGRAALYAGPLLLAFDAYFNDVETTALPALDFDNLELRRLDTPAETRLGHFAPLGRWACRTADGGEVVLCDFASAGAHGTDYVAWLPMAHVPPPPAALTLPEAGQAGTPGAMLFAWSTFGLTDATHEVVIARDGDLRDVALTLEAGRGNRATVTEPLPEGDYFWGVRSTKDGAAVWNEGGPRALRVDAAAGRAFFALGEDGLMAASRLAGDGAPRHGVLDHAQGLVAAEGHDGTAGSAVAFDGTTSELRYALPWFPQEDYSFTAWVRADDVVSGGFQQVFSAWCRGGDDPLRVTVERGEISARIEAATGYVRTPGVALEAGKWVHVAAVKSGGTLTLYLDGNPAGNTGAAPRVVSDSLHVGVGFNPLLPGGERFRGAVEDFAFHAQGLTVAQVRAARDGAR